MAEKVGKIPDQLVYETKLLVNLLPEEITDFGQKVWQGLRKLTHIPKNGDPAEEIKHPFGPVNAFAVGLQKSLQYGRPMLELHGTACPSYLPFIEGQNATKIAVNSLKDNVLYGLSELTAVLGQYILAIHTPSPADIGCDFSGHMSLLKAASGRDQLQKHWQKMKELEKMIGGLIITVDLPFLTQHITKEQAEKLLQQDWQLQVAFEQFKSSRYVNDAYLKWGSDPFDVFCGLYLGTVMAYGNHESAFDLNNPDPVKLYLNFEESHGPETFAGAYTGVDVRHILAKYGYHLPLLVAEDWLRTPWLED